MPRKLHGPTKRDHWVSIQWSWHDRAYKNARNHWFLDFDLKTRTFSGGLMCRKTDCHNWKRRSCTDKEIAWLRSMLPPEEVASITATAIMHI